MIRIQSFGNATKAQIDKLKIALEYCNLASTSMEFRDKVMSAKFTETGDSNAQIYSNTQKNVEINVSFYTPTWWDRFKSWVTKRDIVASEGNGNVQFNASVFAANSIPDVSATIRHEGMHVPAAGNYKHDFLPTAERPRSVPYLCGTYVGDIVASMLRGV